MKALLILAASFSIGCASQSVPKNQEIQVEHAIQEDKMIGESLPSWTSQESDIKDGRLYLTGTAEMSADKNEQHVAKAALMDAEVRLVADAPAEIRVITQNSLTGAGIDSSEYMQIQTKLQEVVGLTGLKSHEYTCRKMIRYGESRTNVNRKCYYQASVSLADLRKAYLMTMKLKYAEDKVVKFDNLMKDELDKINNNKRFDNENIKAPIVPSVSDDQSNPNGASRIVSSVKTD